MLLLDIIYFESWNKSHWVETFIYILYFHQYVVVKIDVTNL